MLFFYPYLALNFSVGDFVHEKKKKFKLCFLFSFRSSPEWCSSSSFIGFKFQIAFYFSSVSMTWFGFDLIFSFAKWLHNFKMVLLSFSHLYHSIACILLNQCRLVFHANQLQFLRKLRKFRVKFQAEFCAKKPKKCQNINCRRWMTLGVLHYHKKIHRKYHSES